MAKCSFSLFVEQKMGKFPHFVLYAVLEWVLILLLFVDGFLAFIANEFAKFFGLQTPCLFCTRIDHVLVHRDRDFYFNDSLCEAHKKEVSSLAYCHNHKKISDIRRMCEACLLSFATEKESDCDTYKSLVGILQKDLECFVDDDGDDRHRHIHLGFPQPATNAALPEEKSEGLRCSCCGEALKTTTTTKKALNHQKGRQYGIGGSSLLLSTQAPAPSPRAPFPRHRSNGELKLMSENESEVTEFDTGSSQEKLREDVKAAMAPLLTEADDLTDEASKTPSFVRGNRFFGIPLTDSASNSPKIGVRISRKSPLEKTESASESVEGNANPTTNDADLDSILHGLKRQVRLDRKSLMALYMELDEERSASAVAANNAMAMITRLQAEKAAVQMEALQYQRMMEEQFEYDQEALQDTNELLIKKEEEIKALEAELEAYREKFGCVKGEDGAEHDDQEPKTHSCYSYDSGRTEIGSSPVSYHDGEANGAFGHDFDDSVSSPVENGEEESHGESLKDFKEEKTYFLGGLDKKDNLAENGIDNETGTRSP